MLGEAAFANLYRVLNHPIYRKKVDLFYHYRRLPRFGNFLKVAKSIGSGSKT